ncbi:hypothetical protein A2U01_0076687 [Trifolium medium]|uniref:Uncharacterized protein n=1 Tax=Trifolium medium TaxID=97028 RepID=A0A392T5J1_9FABA|nr:hypothetical protein [Trifolium medium]
MSKPSWAIVAWSSTTTNSVVVVVVWLWIGHDFFSYGRYCRNRGRSSFLQPPLFG